jgi:hypothetical protein
MKRKTLLLLLVVLLIQTLSGCIVVPEVENEFVLKYRDKEVIDESISYQVEDDSLPVYRYLQDDTVSYVDLEEFVDFLDGGLIVYNIEKDNELHIILRQAVPEDIVYIYGVEYIDFEIVFNHEENTIYTSDLAVFTKLNLIYSVGLNDVVSLVDVTSNNANTEIMIDLDDYNFDILYENDHYYLPFYLANLFLSGASINLYEAQDAIIVFDYGTETEQVSQHYTSSGITLDDVQDVTTNYLALYFDYFYGLKEEKEIDSFASYFSQYNVQEANNFIDYAESINAAIFDLDDLHTRIMDTGYLMPDYVLDDNFVIGSKVDLYSTAHIQNKCGLQTESFQYTQVDEDTHLFQIIRFESDTGDLFSQYLPYLDPNENVVIDVTCNTGGSLQGVIELLAYLTEQNIPVSHINTKTNEIVHEYYTSDIDAVEDINLFVVTSQVTYSAANVFATVVRDLELGMLIGDHTLGGSSALVFTVLPNGMIISNSSYMTFLDENLEINEDGIEVELDYALPINLDTLASDLDSYYKIGTDYIANAVNSFNGTRITFVIESQDDDIANSEYILNVYDSSGNIIYSDTYSESFTVRNNFGDTVDNLTIELIAIYEYNTVQYEDVIFSQEATN